MLSIYSSGRDENFFKKAHLFLPERWDRQTSLNKENSQDPFASLPFGHGRRACVGRRLAETQMFIFLQKVNLLLCLHIFFIIYIKILFSAHQAISTFIFKTNDEAKMIMRLLGTIDKPLQLHLTPREKN
jgi:hypothetical protein